MPRFSRALIVLLLLAPGAALAQVEVTENDYTPTPQTLRAITVEQARDLVAQELPKWGFRPAIPPPDGTGGIASLKVDLSRLEIIGRNGGSYIVPLANAQISVEFGNFFNMVHGIAIDGNIFGGAYSQDEDEVKHLVDALYVLKNAAHESPGDDAAFAQVVAGYRQVNPKPALPEDVRRFDVQAKGAIKDGDFAGAALLYQKALDVAPWWPGGHYNRAAVLAEIGEYQLAMAEMRRYLLLVPDAPDARADQDMIYDWERQANKAAAQAPAAPPVPAGGK